MSRLAGISWRRFASFGALQVFNAIAPLVVLPSVIAAIGQRGWVGFAIGFSIGAAAAVAIAFAWPITGPAKVAGQPLDVAREVFGQSLTTRFLVIGPVLAVSLVAVALLRPAGESLLLPAAMALATALNGMSASWYYIGRAEARNIVVYETVPKLVATVLAIPAIELTGYALLYPVLLIVGSLCGFSGECRQILGRWGNWPAPMSDSLILIRHQLPVAAAGVLSTGATALAVPIASVSSASLNQVASFAAGTRLRSMAQAGIGAATTATQGWVSESGRQAWRARARHALLVNGALGLVAAVCVVLLVPTLGSRIFGSDISIRWSTSGFLAAACFFYALSSSLTNHILAPIGEAQKIVISTMIASIVSAPAILLGASLWGATGAMAGVAIAEGLVVLQQGGYCMVRLRRSGAAIAAANQATLAVADADGFRRA